jgi:hypothetical protein
MSGCVHALLPMPLSVSVKLVMPSRAEAIQQAADEAVHTLQVAVWAAMPFDEVRSRVRKVVQDASDGEVHAALSALEKAGRTYRRPQSEEEKLRDPDGWYGPGQTIAYDVQEVPDREGGLALNLVIEDRVAATARAARDALRDLEATFGMLREEVAEILRAALEDHMKRRLDKVRLARLRQLPGHDLRFAAVYVYRSADDILGGLAWYDVSAGEEGPDSVPDVVRNWLRSEVHRSLAAGRTIKQAS